MAELSTVDTFKHSIHLAENIFKSLSEIAAAMGKSKFRPFLDEPVVIDNAFRNAKSDINNRSLSAQTFIVDLGKIYGDGIFRGILSMVDDSYIGLYLQYKAQPAYLPSMQPY
jgi:hypothetical protein